MQGAIVLPVGSGAAARPADASAEYDPETPGPFGRTLRIALAMKGGVSLAVWIGGAVAELDTLRRVRLTGSVAAPGAVLLSAQRDAADRPAEQPHVIRRATVYAQLLVARRYDAVEFDVLAGASAGGLNAVMYAVAQRMGAATDDILQTWQRSGDIWKLLRPGGLGSIDSVLQGDDFFWGEMRDALVELRSKPHLEVPAPEVSIDLSATVIDGQASRERGTREGKAHFHFSGGGDTELEGRRIPTHGSEAGDEALERLAYAARSTSSFPGAFEPARIYSGVEAAPPDAVDMREAFHAHRKPRDSTPLDVSAERQVTDPFRVVDGGVTDNVPIERALRAIRRRRADYYVDRALIYLDPSPQIDFDALMRPTAYHGGPPRLAAGGRAAGPPDRRSAFLSTVLTALGMKAGQESKDDEVDDVERYRRLLTLDRGRDSLFAPVTDELFDPQRRPPSARGGGNPERVALAHARFRSAADHDQLVQALVEPSVWRLPTALPGGAVHRGWTREELIRLEQELRDAYTGLTPQQRAGITTGAQAQVDACRCLIAWVRALEDTAFEAEGFGLAALDEAWAETDRAGRQALRRRLHDTHRDALLRRDAAIDAVLTRADASVAEDEDADPATLAHAVASAWILHSNAPTPVDGEPWTTLDGLVDVLRRVSGALGALPPAAAIAADWAQSPWAGIARTAAPFQARDLAPLVAVRGIPVGMPAIKYDDITAEESRHALAYPTLLHAQMVAGYRGLLQMRAPDAKELLDPTRAAEGTPQRVSRIVDELMPRDRLRPGTKLAGMGIANFAGFLSEDWRTNDWWWGRLDAAHGAVTFLGALPPPRRPSGADPDCDALADSVEAAVLEQWSDATTDATADDATPFRERLGRDVGGLAALGPSYRVAVASRLIRLLSRAVVRGASAFAPQRVALWLLRPLLVFAPAVLDPARAAVVAALVLAPLFLLRAPEGDTGPILSTLAVLLAACTVALMAVDFTKRANRSRIVRSKLCDARRTAVRDSVRRAGWVGGGVGVGALVLVALALWRMVAMGRVDVAVWVLLLVALALAIAARSLYLVPRLPSGHSPVRAVVGYVLAALILLLAWRSAGALSDADATDLQQLTVVAGGTGAAAALALTLGWLWGFAPQRGAREWLDGAAALVATVALSGVAAGAPFLLLALRDPAPALAFLEPLGDWVTITGSALAALWLWGTVLWWVPAWWQPAYTPSDRPARRRPRAPTSA